MRPIAMALLAAYPGSVRDGTSRGGERFRLDTKFGRLNLLLPQLLQRIPCSPPGNRSVTQSPIGRPQHGKLKHQSAEWAGQKQQRRACGVTSGESVGKRDHGYGSSKAGAGPAAGQQEARKRPDAKKEGCGADRQ